MPATANAAATEQLTRPDDNRPVGDDHRCWAPAAPEGVGGPFGSGRTPSG